MVFNSNLIDFFKRHNLYEKEMFDYFSSNSTYAYPLYPYPHTSNVSGKE